MKKLAFILLAIFASLNSFSQDSTFPSSQIGVSYLGLGDNNAIHLTSLDGAASYSGRGYYGIQIDYFRSLNKVLTLETGVGLRNHGFTVHPNTGPHVDDTGREFNTSLLVIPVGLTVNFLKYAFINTGALVTTSLSHQEEISDQNGIGFNLGLGLKYDFQSGVGVYVNPFMAMHSAISLTKENYPERITEGGLKVGLTYQLH